MENFSFCLVLLTLGYESQRISKFIQILKRYYASQCQKLCSLSTRGKKSKFATQFKSSYPGVVYKKMYSEKILKIDMKTPVPETLFK